jgi:hypothetical protein
MFSGTTHAACVWEGSASSFFRCLMETSEVVDDNAARLDGVEAAVWDLSDALLTAGDVLSTVAGEGYALLVDIAPVGLTGVFSDLEGIPEGLLDGDDDTVGRLTCAYGEVPVYDVTGWVCGEASDVTAGEIGDLVARLEALEASSASSVGGGVLYGDYTINNSADLAALAIYTEVTGDLIISASTLPSLTGLEDLNSVMGSLIINDSDSLTSLEGLEGLSSVGNLMISINDSLINFNGLEGLSSVSGDLDVTNNDSLINFNGLEGLSSVGGYLGVSTNSSLLSFDGLEGLSSVGGDLYVSFNDSLLSFDGLEGLSSIGLSLSIHYNYLLTSLDGLGGLTSVSGGISIYYNSVLCMSIVDAFLADLSALDWIDEGVGFYAENDDGC